MSAEAAIKENKETQIDEKITRMGTDNMVHLIIKYSLPSIAGLLVTAIYSLTDGIFIGLGVGDAGIAATTVSMPFMVVAMALYTLLGNGGNIVASIRLGQGKRLDAEKSLGNAIMLIIITGIILAAVCIPLIGPIVTLSGATDASYEMAKNYLTIIIAGFILGGLSGGIGNYMRTAGAPNMNMLFMIVGGIVNIVFDYFAVLVFNWGIEGAAFATIASQGIAGLMTMIFFTRKTTAIRFYVKNLKLEKSMVREIFRLGLAGFFMNALMAITSVVINQLYLHYGDLEPITSTGALAAYGASGRVQQIFFQIVIGITMAAQPIIGYNFGAGLHKRVKSCYWVSAWAAFIGLLIVTIWCEFFPTTILSLFGLKSITMDFAVWTLRCAMIMLPLAGFGIVASTYFMATAQAGKANILILLRQIFLLVPAMYLCPILLPMFFPFITPAAAIILAFPIVDVISTAISMIFLFADMRKLDRLIVSAAQAEEGAEQVAESPAEQIEAVQN